MTMVHWLEPAWLAAAVVLVVLAWWWRGPGMGDWARVMSPSVLTWPIGDSAHHRRWQPALLAASIAALALAGPALRDARQSALRHAQGWIIAVDVSRSMTGDDVSPNRLAVARDIASELLERAGSRSVALIVFAGDAYLAGPLTFDKAHTQSFLRTLQAGIVPIDGSNLRRALALAASAVQQGGLVQARVLIITDAHGDMNRAIPAAAAIARAGHRLDIVTVGSPDVSVNRPTNRAGAERIARAGGGIATHADALGRWDPTPLDLSERSWRRNALVPSAMTTLSWQSLSHWILLLAIPAVLVLFRHNEA